MVAELALDADGRFLAIRHDWICDIGAYPSAAGPFTNTFNAALMATGAYRIPAVYGRTRLAVTNSVPITAYRGAGRPDMAYAVERLVDEAAAQTGIDRIALRRRNLIPRDRFPYAIATAPFPSAYDSADFDALLDVALAESKWDTFPARRAEAARRGRLRGIGCALFIEPAGGVAPSDDVALTFEPNGSILLHEVAIASGQGHETVLPEIVGRALEIDPLRITLLAGRHDGPALNGAGAFGSRSMMSQGAGSAAAAAEVLRKGMELASETLEAAPADIRYAAGDFIVDGTDRRVGLAELARLHPGGLDTTVAYPAPKAFPSGAHVAEVEIDPETGTTEIVGYVSIDDCGVVLNQTLLAGQVLGGLVQGLGQVFGELCVYDRGRPDRDGQFHGLHHAARRSAPAGHDQDCPGPVAHQHAWREGRRRSGHGRLAADGDERRDGRAADPGCRASGYARVSAARMAGLAGCASTSSCGVEWGGHIAGYAAVEVITGDAT